MAVHAANAQAKRGLPAASGAGAPVVPQPPCVLHGGWIPGDRSGKFVLWAESRTELRKPRDNDHPFHLPWKDLVASVSEIFPPRRDAGAPWDESKRDGAWISLPGDGCKPTPSLELQADIEGEIPEATGWQAWRVDAITVPAPLSLLVSHDLEHLGGSGAIRIGHDLRFWRRLALALAGLARISHQLCL